MAVRYSRDLNLVNPCRNKRCRACGLYLNQEPLFSSQNKSEVFWVGLSAVQYEDGEDKTPLAPQTASGSLIKTIEEPFLDGISFYKTNLVKCVPLKNDKIRYPFDHEMEKCFPNFENEIEDLAPNIIFLLGKQVASFVMKKFLISEINLDINFIPIHHPSYILVYKRKKVDKYIDNIQSLFSNLLQSSLKTA